jgi:hypothetical protein
MNQLKNFFEAERKRVFEPGAYFAKRVMARLDEGAALEYGIWDIVPSSTRPVLAMALMLILCFAAVEMFVPQMPQSGIVESFLEPDQSPAESFLYNDTDVPSRQDVLDQLISPEDQQ